MASARLRAHFRIRGRSQRPYRCCARNESNDLRRPTIGVADGRETLVKAPAQLVRREILVGAASTSNDDAGSGDARKPREADQFPGNPHSCVAYEA
jgi:hypothetical protein